MAQTTAQKLRIKEGFTLLVLHAPENFKAALSPLPEGVKILSSAQKFNQVHWFVVNKAQLYKELDKVLKLVKDNVVCWIYYPKGTSKIQTDLTRDKGWENLLAHNELQWISLISFDKTWSTFGFRIKSEADKRKEEKPISSGNFTCFSIKPAIAYKTAKIVLLPGAISQPIVPTNNPNRK